MSVQIQGDQIKSATINASKIDLTGTFDFSSGTLQAATPTNDADVATKSYVIDLVNGLSYKDPARVGTQSAPAATYSNPGKTLTANSNGAISIDSINLQANDRVLVKSFAGAARVGNGIYKVTTVGDSENPYVLTRTSDFDENDEIPSSAVFVKEGTDADSLFVCQNDSVTLGTTEITFAQASGAGSISAGSGLSKAGNTISIDKGDGLVFDGNKLDVGAGHGISVAANDISINIDGSTLTKSASGLKVASSGVDSLQLAAASVTAAKLNAGVAGDGINGGAGTALSVAPYHGISVDSNGVSINIDGSTLTKSENGLKVASNGVGTAQIAANAITAAEISSAVAGGGIAGGAGTALSIDLATAAGLEISSQKLQVKRQTNSGLAQAASGLAIDLDGSTLQLGVNGISVNTIGGTNILNDAVNESKIVASSLGNGLSGGSGSVIAVDLKPSAPGLEFVSGQLALDINTAAGLNIDSTNGLEVKLEANKGLDFDASTGGLEVEVDDGTVSINGSGELQVTDAGISTAKLSDDSVSLNKLKFRAEFEDFNGTGSATTFDLQYTVLAAFFKKVVVYRNGLRIKYVGSNPSGVDEYKVDNTGVGGVAKITFGTAPSNTDKIFVDYIYNPS